MKSMMNKSHRFILIFVSSDVHSIEMKTLFCLSSVTLVTILMVAEAAITRPDAVLEKLDEIFALVSDYRTYKPDEASLGRFVTAFRQLNALAIPSFQRDTLDAIEENIRRLDGLDTEMRGTLAAEVQNTCIVNLFSTLDLIAELTGFSISNCIDITDPNVFTITEDFLEDVRECNVVVDNLPLVLVKPFVGRNVFTQPEAIIARLQELYDIELSDDQETYDRLMKKSNDFWSAWYNEYYGITNCLKGLDTSVNSSYAAVKSQLTFCRAYGAKNPRNLPIDIARYFPQLK